MPKHIIIHCKHNGCYEGRSYNDNETKTRVTSITINPPKLFFFDDKSSASDFFSDYINDVDVIDVRCKTGDDVIHRDCCTCGIIEMNDDGNPVLFYNKTNQIFLMESSAQVFLPPQDLKFEIDNLNLANKHIRICKRLDREQRERYIELGKVCAECNHDDDDKNEEEEEDENVKQNIELENVETGKDVKDVKNA